MVKLLLAPLLLLTAAAAVRGVLRLPLDVLGSLGWALAGGAIGAMVLGAPRARRPYVIAHELSHWLAARLFARRVGSIVFGRRRGRIEVERPNLWIVLAPYFVPFYALVWLALLALLRLLTGISLPLPVQALGLGAACGYHLAWTARILGENQSDLVRFGRLFSLSLIVATNAHVLFWLLAAVTDDLRGSGKILLAAHLELFAWLRGAR